MKGQTSTSPLPFTNTCPLRPTSLPQPGHSPHPPEGRRVGERVAVDEEEIGGPAFDDATSLVFRKEVSASDCRGRERLPRLEARFDERLDLPGEMVRSQGSAAKIRAGRDPYAGSVSEADALDRPLPPMRDSFPPFVADEPGQCRRLRERGPRSKDRQGGHEERPLTGHLCDRVRVEFESVLEGIDAGVDSDPGPDGETGMRGDLRTATVCEFDDGPHVFRRPRRLLLLRSVEVKLEEVRPIVELGRRRLQEGGAVIRFDREPAREDAAVADPRSRDPNPWSIRVRLPAFAHAEREGAPLAVPRIDGEGGPDVAGPAYSGTAEEVPVVLRDVEQFFRRIGTAVDPVRAARKGDVAVGIDHAGNDRRPSGIDDADARREIALIGPRTDPDDVACVDEKAHFFPQRWPTRVGQGRVPIQGRSGNAHRNTRPRPSHFRRSKRVSPNQTNGGGGWGRPPLPRDAPEPGGPGGAPPGPRSPAARC